jgi:hypothetical protein
VHKTQWLQAMPYSPECLSGATSRGRTMAPEAQMPAQCPDRGQLPEMWAYKFLRKKHFHGVLAGKTHQYSLISRIGKARHFFTAIINRNILLFPDNQNPTIYRHLHELYI